MDAYQMKTGGSVLAIAHNGNLSNGTMFPVVEAFGKAINREYAEQRAKWERLYETTQEERIAAFQEYADDVKKGRFPEARHLVAIDEAVFKQAISEIEGKA